MKIRLLSFMTFCMLLIPYVANCGEKIDATKGSTVNKNPLFDIRALHLTLRKSTGNSDPVKQTKEDVLKTIHQASLLGFNVLILKVNLAIELENTPKFASQWAYSKDEVREILAAARQDGMEVIPEINLLTHQHLLMLQINKNLMLNDADYDPNNPDVYKIVFPILDEIIQIFQPKYIHVGHDEAYGIRDNGKVPLPTRRLKPEEYLNHIVKVRNYLKNKGIVTMMWADMLIDPKIFGTLYHPAEVNGHKGFADIINYLPKDIILCDWHYISKNSEFPSYTYLQKKGFVVWGATWKDPSVINAFSAYVAKHAHIGEGLIATTWWPFVSQEKETINLIIETTAKAFFK